MGRGNFLPIVAAALLILVVAGFIIFKSSFQGNNQPTPDITPTIAQSDLPPLYPDIGWKPAVRNKIQFIKSDGDKIEIEGYTIESSTLNSYPYGFIGYYNEWLSKRGWKEVNAATAGGPGSESLEYEKDSRYFQFGVDPLNWPISEYRAIIQYSQ